MRERERYTKLEREGRGGGGRERRKGREGKREIRCSGTKRESYRKRESKRA